VVGIGCVYMVVNEAFRIKAISDVMCQIVRQLHLTADKREIKDFPKLPSATSFIRKTLYDMPSNNNLGVKRDPLSQMRAS
jgi:hypothetical protein